MNVCLECFLLPISAYGSREDRIALFKQRGPSKAKCSQCLVEKECIHIGD